MEEIRKRLEELKGLAGKTDPESEARKAELTQWLNGHPEAREEVKAFMTDWLEELEADNEQIKQQSLREQMDDDIYKMLPLSIIAKRYFGKSAAWLSQRINGSPVRGKVYTLNEEQKATFNRATREIGQRISSFQMT